MIESQQSHAAVHRARVRGLFLFVASIIFVAALLVSNNKAFSTFEIARGTVVIPQEVGVQKQVQQQQQQQQQPAEVSAPSLKEQQREQRAVASEAFNEAWHKTIGTNISCFKGEKFGNVTFPISPHFIIIGAQKAGTTAMGHLLQMHPQLQRTHEVEAHFFDGDKVFLQNKDKLDDEATLCMIQERYHQHYWQPLEEKDYRKVFFEKTPRYIIWPDVPKHIQQVCPWNPKIVAILRDPIDRLYSHHKMNSGRDRGTAGTKLDIAIDQEISNMRGVGLTNAPLLTETRLHHNNDAAFAIPNLALREREDIVRETLNDKETAELWIVQRGMYAVHLESWLKHYQLGVNMLVIQYERMHSEPVRVWEEIQDFLQVPRFDLDRDVLSGDYSPTKSSFNTALSNTTTAYLKKFYQPYNDRLADLLGEEWRGVWD